MAVREAPNRGQLDACGVNGETIWNQLIGYKVGNFSGKAQLYANVQFLRWGLFQLNKQSIKQNLDPEHQMVQDFARLPSYRTPRWVRNVTVCAGVFSLRVWMYECVEECAY